MALTRLSVATAVALVLATNARTAAAQSRPTTAAQANAAQLNQAQGGVVQPISDADKLADDMRVIGASPNDVSALSDAGERSLQLGDLSGAASLFARADKVDPRNGRVKAGLASLLLHSERPGEALRYFDQAEGYGYPVARFAAERGLAYDLIGQQQRAQRDYRTALATVADDETVRRLALSLGISGRAGEALKELEPLLRRNDRGAWRARAFVLAMAGDVAGASNIATTMMPGGVAQGLRPFFERLPTLPAPDRAFAVHFGEVRATPQRLADARLAPPLAPLPPEVRPPIAVAANTVAVPATTGRARDRKRRGREQVAAATVPVAVPAPVRTAIVAPFMPAASPVRTTAAPVAVAVAVQERRPAVRVGTRATAPYPGFSGFVPDQPALRSERSRVSSVLPPAPRVVVPVAPAIIPHPVAPGVAPASPLPALAPVQVASVAPPRSLVTAAVAPAPSVVPGLSAAVPVSPAMQVASAAPPRTVAPVTAAPAPRVVAALPAAAPGAVAAVPAPTPTTVLPVQVAASPPPVPAITAAGTAAPAAAIAARSLSPASAPATVAATPPPARAVEAVVPITERSVAANVPTSPLRGEDAILARIIAGISVPASELGVEPVPRPAVAPAPAPVAAPTPVAVTAAAPTRPVASARLRRDAPVVATADPAVEQAATRQAAADKKLADRKAAAKAAADKKAAAAKALADQEAADERAAAAEEKKAARTNPSRIWVQVAGGANEGDLEKAWSGARSKAAALQGHSGWTTPLRATNRVLTGPFKTDAEARAFVNQLAKQGVSAFPFTSDQGQKVTKLGGR